MVGALRLAAVVVLLGVVAGRARARDYSVTVRAGSHGYHGVPVAVEVDRPPQGTVPWLRSGGREVPADGRTAGERAIVTWILDDLAAGASRTYRLAFRRPPAGRTSDAVRLRTQGANLRIDIGGLPFATYDTTTGPNKPYFYPLYGPGSKMMVRRWPLEEAAGETHDHPHHRGLWFTHGSVNGQDYWSEGKDAARTIHRRYARVQDGRVSGFFQAETDWVSREGTRVATDVRDVTVYRLPDGYLMDLAVTLKPDGGPLVFGDTKEGSFGLRVPDSMRVAGGDGHIETSAGARDGAAWGKRADWVDYYGTVGGTTMGVAIMDDPRNLRHPTYWHVRDYGLFAANPFGVHDFAPAEPPHAGDYTVAAGASQTFRYRIYLHRGTTSEARVADLWAAYADPPTIEVR